MGEEQPRSGPGSEPAVDEESRDEGFLNRWSRLKRESKQGAGVPAPAHAPPAEPEVAEESKAEPPGDEDMPPLESLGPDSDYSAFMSPRVSQGLRQRALRQLFRTPKFNVVDGLDVYAEDYTNFKPLGDVMTADLKFRMERKLKEALAKASAAGEEGESPAGLASDHVEADSTGTLPGPESGNQDSPEDEDDQSHA